mmetsp:Transcript_642/g.1587  ORF Transcript_642/g.1587 Transcript_642/m.1587 type:complete len:218 (+) Transcript_642:369-1022(+)
MLLASLRLLCTASSIRRNCSTLNESFPDKSTSVSILLASTAFTKYSPACIVIPFLDSINTRRVLFSRKASANLMTPFWSSLLAVRLLLSRFSDCKHVFFRKASAIASADLTPKLLPSHSNFCKQLFCSNMPPRESPSSSHKPFRFRSMDMHEVFSPKAFVSNRSLTEPNSSMQQRVMWGALVFRVKVSKIVSRPPSIFFRCSSSSRRLRSNSSRFCS